MKNSWFTFIFSNGEFEYIGELSKATESFATFEIDNDLSDLEFWFDSSLYNGSKSDNDTHYDPYITDTQSNFNNNMNSYIDSYLSSHIGIVLDESNNSRDGASDNFKKVDYGKLWAQCDNCYEFLYRKFNKMYICEKCGKYLRISSKERIELLIDAGTWDPMDEDMVSLDPIEWDWEQETSTVNLKYKEYNLRDHLKYLKEQSEKLTRVARRKLLDRDRAAKRKLLESQEGTSQVDSPEETSQVDSQEETSQVNLKRCQEQIDHFAWEARRQLLESLEETSQVDSQEETSQVDSDVTRLEEEFDRLAQVDLQEGTYQVDSQEETSQVDLQEALSQLDSDVTRLQENLERLAQADSPEERDFLVKISLEEEEEIAREKEEIAREKEEIAREKEEIARLAQVALHAQEEIELKRWQEQIEKLYRETRRKFLEWLEETFPSPFDSEDSEDSDSDSEDSDSEDSEEETCQIDSDDSDSEDPEDPDWEDPDPDWEDPDPDWEDPDSEDPEDTDWDDPEDPDWEDPEDPDSEEETCQMDSKEGTSPFDLEEETCQVDSEEGTCQIDSEEETCQVDSEEGTCQVDSEEGTCQVDSEEEIDLEEEEEEETYKERIDYDQKTLGLTEAVQTGTGKLNGIRVAIGVMDFAVMGGSMGSVVGEKITRLIEYATNQRLPLILVCASGGARMQEGSLSLMQMAKISSALYDYQSRKRLFYISILTDPTTGGVTASFGMLGDIVIAEPDAYIAFAGKRVIEETLKLVVPEDSQVAELLFHHGLLDAIVPRNILKGVLSELFQLHAFFPVNKN